MSNDLSDNEEKLVVPIISFIGYSKSGKTASIEAVIDYLTRSGKKVIALKNLHREGFTIDTPGKNTWRYTQAGAKITVANSPNESALLFNWQLRPTHIIKILYQIGLEDGEFSEKDEIYALLEGFRSVGEVKVLCVKDFEEIQEQMDPSVKYLSGQINEKESEITLADRKYDLPIVNLLKNPESIDEILREL